MVYKAKRKRFERLKHEFATNHPFLFAFRDEVLDMRTELPHRLELAEKQEELNLQKLLVQKYFIEHNHTPPESASNFLAEKST